MERREEFIVTCSEMKDIERRADEGGLSYYQMMENAGKAAAAVVAYNCPAGGRIAAFCGKGNNGGDGFVAARLLKEEGFDVTVILVDGRPVTEDSITNFGLLEDVAVYDMKEGDSFDIEDCDAVIDAVYGTGFHGELRPRGLDTASSIADLREKGAKVIAFDIPSGLGGDLDDEEDMEKRSVRADITVTFHAKKPVHVQDFAQDYLGEVVTADIGIRL